MIKDNVFKFKLSNENFVDKKIDFCFFCNRLQFETANH